ncbi:MAG: hypothetical protein AABY22_24660 [Nanoarchaeota archaeon]
MKYTIFGKVQSMSWDVSYGYYKKSIDGQGFIDGKPYYALQDFRLPVPKEFDDTKLRDVKITIEIQ